MKLSFVHDGAEPSAELPASISTTTFSFVPSESINVAFTVFDHFAANITSLVIAESTVTPATLLYQVSL